ncbi:MAG: PEP-CTERM sorting domain-containing protein [Candidatus Acidiferrales bacterium]
MRQALIAFALVALFAIAYPASAAASGSTVNILTPTYGNILFVPVSVDAPGVTVMEISDEFYGSATGTGLLASATKYYLCGEVHFHLTGPGQYATAVGAFQLTLNAASPLGPGLLNVLVENVTAEQTGTLFSVTGTRVALPGYEYGPGSSGITDGQFAMMLTRPSAAPITSLTGSEYELATFKIGEGVANAPAVTPEPGTMLLFGSGIVLIGGLIRHKCSTNGKS